IHAIERSGISGRALKDGQLIVDGMNRFISALHIFHAGSAGADDDGLSERSHVLEERNAFQISGSKLVSRNVQLRQEVRAFEIERRREEIQSKLGGEIFQLAVLIPAELQSFPVASIGVTVRIFA